MTHAVYYGAVCRGPSSLGIVFPDFWGCISTADTVGELIASAHEALQGHVELMVAEGFAIPEPTEVTLDRVRLELDDPDELDDGEEWIDVVPILVNIPDSIETLGVPINVSLLRQIGKVSNNNADFIDAAIRDRLHSVRKSA
jgi:predicted RNase H-like HicB family nuclease